MLRLPGSSDRAARANVEKWGFTCDRIKRVNRGRVFTHSELATGAADTGTPETRIFFSFADIVDRHFHLLGFADSRERDTDRSGLFRERVCWQWCLEADILLPALQRWASDIDAVVPLRLVNILELRGDNARAHAVCQAMLGFRSKLIDNEFLRDTTKRLSEKIAKIRG